MKETTRSAIIAVLATVAVAFVAATLNSTVTTEQRGPSGPGSGSGEGDGGLLPLPQSGSTPGETVQVPFLSEVLTMLAGIATLAILVYLIIYWRDALKIILALAVLLGLLFILIQVLSSQTSPATPPLLEPGNGSALGGGGGGGGSGSDTLQPSPTSVIVLLILGLAFAGAVIAFFRTTANDSEDLVAESETDASNAAAVGRVAGRAADRLEQEADVDNEVYRTWREMTDLLAVPNPHTCTPGEFADAAVEAGLGREDVGELTRLFEDVRYGEMEPTDEHERQAVTLFRRIEDRYAEDES